MTGKTHQIIGIVTGLGWYLSKTNSQYSPATLGAVLIGAHLGALLPDLDQSAAELYDSVPFGHTIGKVTSKVGLGHRNLTHSILGVAIFGFFAFKLIGLFPEYWGIDKNFLFLAFIIAYLSHLIADSITTEGIPLLFPYHKMFGLPPKPLEGIRIMTGQWFENLIIFPLINVALIILIIEKWAIIKTIVLK